MPRRPDNKRPRNPFNGCGKKRRHNGDRNPLNDNDNEDEGHGRVPKRKYAVIFGYLGTGYHGMQKQANEGGRHLPTIEGDLEAALLKSEGITQFQVDNPERLIWSRVGRTDAGVHAACQVVTLKLSVGPLTDEEKEIMNRREQLQTQTSKSATSGGNSLLDDIQQTTGDAVSGDVEKPEESSEMLNDREALNIEASKIQSRREEKFIDRLKKELPAPFELYDVVRVTGNFDARFRAQKRQYEYCIPSHALRRFDLHDNSEVIRKLYGDFILEDTRRFGDFKVDPQILDVLDLANPDHIIVPFSLKQKAYDAMQKDGEELAACWEIPESMTDPKLLSSRGMPATKLNSTSSISEIFMAWRYEMWTLRKIYGSMDGEQREALWRQYPEWYRPSGTIPAYAPPILLAVRPSPDLLRPSSEPASNANAQYKLSDSEFERFRSILKKLEGRNHWFNFTSRLRPEDPSGERHIHKVELYRAFESPEQGEHLIVRLLGQSFLLNQIRKMISLAIEIFVGSAPLDSVYQLCKSPLYPKKHVHLAPGEGLLLERPFFDISLRKEDSGRGMYHPALHLHDSYECEHPYGELMQKWRKEGLMKKSAIPIDPKNGPMPSGDMIKSLLDEDDDDTSNKITKEGVVNSGMESSSTEASSTEASSTEASSTEAFSISEGCEDKDESAEWVVSERDENSSVRKIIDFKFDRLFPEILRNFKENSVWPRYLFDLAWHSFYSENLPMPMHPDLIHPNNVKNRLAAADHSATTSDNIDAALEVTTENEAHGNQL